MSISLAAQSLDDCQDLILKKLKGHAEADLVQIIRGTKGQWRTVASTDDSDAALPIELLADVLDQEKTLESGQHVAALLDSQRLPGQLLLVSGSNGTVDPDQWDSLAA